MKSTHRSVRLAFGLTIGLALALFSGPPAAAAGGATSATYDAPVTWKLLDYQQAICVDTRYGRSTYFLIVIQGSWSAPIEVTARELPDGSTAGTPHAFIPPGSNDDHNVLTLVPVVVPPTPIGVYGAVLWASDAVETQTVPITIRVQERCP